MKRSDASDLTHCSSRTAPFADVQVCPHWAFGGATRVSVHTFRVARWPRARSCSLGDVVPVAEAAVGVADRRSAGARGAVLVATCRQGYCLAARAPVHAAGVARRPRALGRALGRIEYVSSAAVGIADGGHAGASIDRAPGCGVLSFLEAATQS